MSHKITPFIRCTDNGQEVVNHYLSIFPGAKITKQSPMVISFEIFGQSLATLTAGPNDNATLNPSISFSLWIKDLELTKQLRDKLSEWWTVMMEYAEYERSPGYGRCNDKYGVSRQVMYDNREDTTNNALVPSLMYTWVNNGKTKEAMEFYTALFPNSKIDFTRPYGENTIGENPEHLNHAEFKLVWQQFIAMDSWLDHKFSFNDGISLAISCDGQEEIDKYRNILALDGGQEVQCGRCKDKYGISRQIFPIDLPDALFSPDQAKAQYAMNAMMKMKKIVIEDLYEK